MLTFLAQTLSGYRRFVGLMEMEEVQPLERVAMRRAGGVVALVDSEVKDSG